MQQPPRPNPQLLGQVPNNKSLAIGGGFGTVGTLHQVRIRGQLDALMSRPVFYELADIAVDHDGVTGVWSQGEFYPLEVDGADA